MTLFAKSFSLLLSNDPPDTTLQLSPDLINIATQGPQFCGATAKAAAAKSCGNADDRAAGQPLRHLIGSSQSTDRCWRS